MPALARLAAALAAVTPPALSLAQEAGGGAGTSAPRAGFGWLWLLVAAIVVVVLFGMLVVRDRGERPNPPARHP